MSAEWHAWRAAGIGGSDIAAICGLSPWATPYSVWADKVGVANPQPESERMRWGHLLERAIADEFQARTGLYVAGEQSWCQHKTVPIARATVDGFVVESPESNIADALGVIEIKTSGDSPWHDVPDYYQLQVQWQMAVTDMPVAWVASLHRGQALAINEVRRDDALITDLLHIAEQFWQRVLSGDAPPVDATDATTQALVARWQPEPTTVDVSHLADVVARLRDVRAECKALEEEAALLANILRNAMGPSEVAVVGDTQVATWKARTARRIDTKALEAEMPEVATKFRTEHTSRVFLLRGEK